MAQQLGLTSISVDLLAKNPKIFEYMSDAFLLEKEPWIGVAQCLKIFKPEGNETERWMRTRKINRNDR